MLFSSKKESATAVLEVGIQCGGSIKLWADYFKNAKVYGIDIQALRNEVPTLLDTNTNVVLYTNMNAYDPVIVNKQFVVPGLKFDIILDDGCHSYNGMVNFIKHYLPLLKDDGILVIEDVPSIERIEKLKEITPEEYKKYIQVFDLRYIKQRFDDIIFVINKTL
jgi:cephalosporin hydroxylase